MSAQFWTKILQEVKAGKHGNYDEWSRSLDKEAFETQTIYYNDIINAVLEWFDNPKTKLPRKMLSRRANFIIAQVADRCVKMYLADLKKDAMQIRKVMVRPVSIGGPGSFEVIFSPGSTAARKAFDNKRRRQLERLGNVILNKLRNDKRITLARQIYMNSDGTGRPYPRRAPSSIFKSTSQIENQNLQQRLHGDTEHGRFRRTTVAAYGGRSAVRDTSTSQITKNLAPFWTKLAGTDIQDFFLGKDIFQQKLIEFIDMEFGFNITQPTTIDSLKDKYIMFYTQRGTSKQNQIMTKLGADAPKVFDEIINKGITAVRKDMQRLYNSKGFAASIQGSPSVRERGKRAVTKQVLDPLKKAKNTKVSSKTKKPTKRSNKKTPIVKTTKARRTRKNPQKPQNKKSFAGGVSVGAGAGKQRGTQGGSPIALLTLINKALPKELQKNMTGVFPRSLEHRTGRFGASAQVTQVIPFPRMTEIQYTYQKDPYAVFEPDSGDPRATPGRDPKRIIGGTIREIAQSIMGTKFGLVRTKRV
tara:strand:+ start:7003 stop:8589 length:1587 start_codon:yes stop_codon:yes gene_type:complete